MSNTNAHAYWQANLKIVVRLLCVWFFISFICGIVLADFLDQFRIGGFKLGFWMAQQGSIYGFVILIYVYIHLMDKLDKKFDLVHGQSVPDDAVPPASGQQDNAASGEHS